MSENKKFVLVLIVILSIFFGERIYRSLKKEKRNRNLYSLELQEHRYGDDSKEVDINSCTLEELLTIGVNIKVSEKIIEYRSITGGFQELNELKRISGIGEKTYKKLREKFYIGSKRKLKKLNINLATEKELKYYGFNKKEIGKLRNYIDENGKIFDNITLYEILGRKKYNEISDEILY